MSQSDVEMSNGVRVIQQKQGPVYVEWQIEDYFTHTEEGTCLKSPRFCLSDKTSWWLQIYPNGDLENARYIHFFLMKSTSDRKYDIAFKLGIMKNNGSVFHAEECEHNFDETGTGCGFDCFLPTSNLLRSIETVGSNGILRVFCFIRFAENAVKEIACGTESLKNVGVLTQNFRDSYLAGRLCDVTITVKDKDFHAHKFVLASRSPVFAAIFEHLMAETGSNTVNITDCDPDSFNDFLLFLYTAKLQDILPSNVFGLYETANKYHVKELMAECLLLMESHLSEDTFSETVLIAVQYYEPELLTSAIRYFIKNRNTILESPKWRLFVSENSDVANEFFVEFWKVVSEE